MTTDEVEALIRAGLPEAAIAITDLTGTGDHFRAEISADAFSGKSKIEQHQLVYRALGTHMGGAIHALQLLTKTP